MVEPLFLKPRLRLFLSADIVGSTGLKQVPLAMDAKDIHDQHTIWFLIIQGFYVEAAQALGDEWSRASKQWPDDPLCFGEGPRLWKTIGDEVLFEKIITDHRQVTTTLSCWIRALDRMRDFLREKNARLDVKSTAWLAGFPVVNKEVVLDTGIDGPSLTSQNYFTESGNILNRYYGGESVPGLVIDYVGPAIDTGFRLAAFATPRKLVVSVGIAYVLSKTSNSGDGRVDSFRVMFTHSAPMKGVMGGRHYPVFWIDLSVPDSLDRCEDALTGADKLTDDKIEAYCEAFYSELGSYAFKPFVDEPTEQQVRGRPPWYGEILKMMAANFLSESAALSPDAEQGVDESGDTPTAKTLRQSAEEFAKKLQGAAPPPEVTPKK